MYFKIRKQKLHKNSHFLFALGFNIILRSNSFVMCAAPFCWNIFRFLKRLFIHFLVANMTDQIGRGVWLAKERLKSDFWKHGIKTPDTPVQVHSLFFKPSKESIGHHATLTVLHARI